MKKRSLLCVIVAGVMLFGSVFTGCAPKEPDDGEKPGGNTDGNYTVSAEAALKYEQNLTWGE